VSWFSDNYKQPRTVNERRQNERDSEWVRIRGSRLPHSLPTDYDDVVRARRSNGWKHSTKHKCQFGGSRFKIEYDDSYLDPDLETYKLYGEEE